MPNLDWDRVRREKDASRDIGASLPFDEKLRAMEMLRDRAVALRGFNKNPTAEQVQPASNILVSIPQSQNVRSVVNLAVFGAAATLVAAIAPSIVSSRASAETPVKRTR